MIFQLPQSLLSLFKICITTLQKNTRYEANCYFTMINQRKYFLFYLPLDDFEGVYGHIFSYRRQLDFLLA